MVNLWWAGPEDAHGAFLDWFTADERGRADAYRNETDRQRFIVGCALSRIVVAARLSIEPGDVPIRRSCPDCGRPHGRPRVEGSDLSLSVSHSGAAVVVALTDRGDIGVDVERIDVTRQAPVSLTLAKSEQRQLATSAKPDEDFFRYWVRKEAVIKATGEGLRTPPASVVVSGPAETARLVTAPGLDPENVTLVDIGAPAGHAAALAVIGASTIVARRLDGSTTLKCAATRAQQRPPDVGMAR